MSFASDVLLDVRFGAPFTEGFLLRDTFRYAHVPFAIAVQRGCVVTLALAVVHDLSGATCRALSHALCFRCAIS